MTRSRTAAPALLVLLAIGLPAACTTLGACAPPLAELRKTAAEQMECPESWITEMVELPCKARGEPAYRIYACSKVAEYYHMGKGVWSRVDLNESIEFELQRCLDKKIKASQMADELSKHAREWYGKMLEAMDEPDLGAEYDEKTFRFVYLRSFHEPIVVRLSIKEDGTGSLNVKKADGKGGYEPGKLVVNETLAVPREKVQQFLDIIEKMKFWELPTVDESVFGLDGAQWILEGWDDGESHIVDRWSPNSCDGYAQLMFWRACVMLLDMTELKMREDERY